MKVFFRIPIAIAFIFNVLVGCEVDTDTDKLKQSATVIADNLAAQDIILRGFENVNNYGFRSAHSKKSSMILDNEPVQQWDGNDLLLDYTDLEGFGGQILVSFSDEPQFISGLNITISFNNFMYQNHILLGTLNADIIDYAENTSLKYAIENVGGLSISGEQNDLIWNCIQTIKVIAGVDTDDNSDDEFLINGTAIQFDDEVNNEMQISNLLYSNNCDFIKSGEMQFTENETTITDCNFGVDQSGEVSEACNAYATISSQGISITYNFE